MDKIDAKPKVSSDFISSDIGQKIFMMLSSPNHKNLVHVQRSTSVQKPIVKVNKASSNVNSDITSVRKTIPKIPRTENNVIKKQDTTSSNRSTHIQKFTHRDEQRQLASASRNARDEDHSDDGFDLKQADLRLLKLVKRTLLRYIEEIPSRKLKSGELTATEIRPYIRDVHFPRFKKYLLNKGIQAPNIMILKCIKDLHISRRDVWLKKQRKLREERSQEQLDSAEALPPRTDGYVAFKSKMIRE
ncbi:1974_t:CDS:2 [Funneliformis geosporum]|uniref:1891_t:CDS:1 n=1 Tax=Funneliformis geosporum TaxID=1117311 RepID=A0A9W4WQM9_9GLOM|nr:1974_t:CDS:2 [Funneliformis geosporum]CAI2171667.1 1891_t:CDS:2 [Funneliformis geosporum]